MRILALLVTMTALLCGAAEAQQTDGPVGHWSFDEAVDGAVPDVSGNGNDGALRGAMLVPRGDGQAVSLDGVDDYVDCGDSPSLDLREAVTLEAWINPAALPANEPMILGKYYDSFGLTHYRDGNTWFYISGGGNNLKARLAIGEWSHVVATFDGTTMTLYVNRVKLGAKPSAKPAIDAGGRFLMGVLVAGPETADPGYGSKAHWRGLLDDVVVYDRALSEVEILDHYKQSADGYGVDTTWFDRMRVTNYPFRSEERLVSLLDFSGVFPMPDDAKVIAGLRLAGSDQLLQTTEFTTLPTSGRLRATFECGDLPPSEHRVVATLSSPGGTDISGEAAFTWPPTAPVVPDPTQVKVDPLPPVATPANYSVEVGAGGGFTVVCGDRRLPFESSLSYPQGGENRLLPGQPDDAGEAEFRVTTKQVKRGLYEVLAEGPHYSVARRISLEPTRVLVRDTIRNTSGDDLGIILENALVAQEPFDTTVVAGYPEGAERREAKSPSTFVSFGDLGVGIIPLDDVTVVHSTVFARDGRAGVRDDKFGLARDAEYAVEWAVYPVDSADYYDFLNLVRRDENRNGAVDGGFAFIGRSGITPEHLQLRNTRYGSFGCLTHVADDPEIEIEGIEFLWLPKERARIKAEFDAIREDNPDVQLMFHVAHSLVSTNTPDEIFADSRVIDAAGNHVVYPYNYDACAYFSRARHEAGWRWYIYYPMPGNSFHDALMKSVDVMVDEIGCNGAFMDGFMHGYGSPYTYDRWDGHTVDIDPETKTIVRKVGSVLLMSQPSMVEYTERMNAKGARVVANGITMTRTMGRLDLITDQECSNGPATHLAQTPCALGNPGVIRNEADVYTDVLDKLSWGLLYFYYGEKRLTYPSLPQQMFPITIESIHSGIVRGKERIVTSRSGAYGWAGADDLHFAWRYNPIGVSIPADFLTTVDGKGVRTQVELQPKESAVLKRVPVRARSARPVNLIFERYDASGASLILNGRGSVRLEFASGDFVVTPGARYVVSGVDAPVVADADGVLRVTVPLRGQTEVTVAPIGT